MNVGVWSFVFEHFSNNVGLTFFVFLSPGKETAAKGWAKLF